MTKHRLKQCYSLHLELNTLDKKIKRLEAKCEGGAIILTDMPRGGVPPDYMTDLADIIMRRERLKMQVAHEIAEIEKFIGEIPDSRTRLIFRYRYVDGLKWAEIAGKVNYSRRQTIRKHNNIINAVL